MTFPHSAESVSESFGYHPLHEDIVRVSGLVAVTQLLIFGPDVPDVVEDVAQVRFLGAPPAQLPRGIYWFANGAGVNVLLVAEGAPAAPGLIERVADADSDGPLVAAQGWHSAVWASAQEVPSPQFSIGDEVIVVGTGQDSVIRGRRFTSGVWLYDVRLEGRRQTLREDSLAPFPDDDDPTAWVNEAPAEVDRFAATLTRAKLEGSFTDTVFSFRATRTLFRPYQFKPVIKLLQTGKSRLLIADEVGLGKTIEAGLIWTELEARRSADRVLVVSPSNLVAKWRREMEERFNFTLEELSGSAIAEFEERARTGRLPRRAAYIGSLERLRRWEGLEDLTGVIPQFDLVIFDEAHYLRNVGTRSNAFGALIGELTDNMVFLSATPLNLRSEDLFNLLDLLSPGEFGDPQALEEQLEPNAFLHKIAESLDDRTSTARERLVLLESIGSLTFGAPLVQRPELTLLRELLADDPMTASDIVKAKRYLADLNALSATITRTRKVEVDESKAMREPRLLEVHWSEAERDFYREYFAWCKARADAAGTPVGFSMQMPLRLASACLPAACDMVLSWSLDEPDPLDEDAAPVTVSASAKVPPHPELLAAARQLGDTDTKLAELIPRVEELVESGRQVLLFTFSRPTLEYLREHLRRRVRVAVMHGGVSKEARRKIMAEFRAGAYDIVLANRVASEGLDFEFCSVVINYDLPWNPMEVEQRIGRIDRIGQVEEKIIVVNFYNESTIDERILLRVLERIGVFERSIGALEPIIQSRMADLQQAMFDFTLSEQQRETKTNQVLQAMEAQAAGIEDLASASSFLLTSDDVDVSGMEDDLLRTGRYVGHRELQHLVADWCHIAGAPGISIAADGRTMTLRGNAKMAQQLQGLVTRGQRSTIEVQDLIGQLQAELEINLVLDQELARTSGGSLLTANHPLVVGALSVPGFTNSRFARISLTTNDPNVPTGQYFVQLGIAEWTGVRPGREIWGSAVHPDGDEASTHVVNALLAQLATGGLRPGGDTLQASPTDLVARTSQLLARRQVTEAALKDRETSALLDARRISLATLHARKLQAIDARIATAQQRDRTRAIPLFKAQRRRAEDRYRQLIAQLDGQSQASLQVHPLAVCEVEINHG